MGIRRLDPAVAARIAAGEVVERPASIVKELIENAIDADARRISVEIEGGGIEQIRVADDGHGISSGELPLAFERHATSKLSSDDDLERIATLGFRGEALPSIAAVADVDCLTRVDNQPHGWRLTLRGGAVEGRRPGARVRGTTVTVRELFAALPARRKFLRGRSGEAGQIAMLVSQLALAYPEIAISLAIDGRVAIETPGDGDLLMAVAAVHGTRVAEQMLRVSPESSPLEHVIVGGCLGNGTVTLPTRTGVTILVNRRWVQHRGLSYALDEAYQTLLPIGRHPIVVLDLRLPAADVDVNVHPRKTEVRLLRDRAVFAAVQKAVRRTLGEVAGPAMTGLLDTEHGQGGGLDGDWTTGLHVLGQAGGTYIIAEGTAGLYLVDQHAAHERVLYEALRAAWTGRREVQSLLQPAVLELPVREATIVGDHFDALAELGFDAEAFGDRTILVRSIPAVLATRDPLATLRSALAALAEEAAPTDWRERLAILFACHNAVRAGDTLSTEEMAALLEQLGEAELCQACSHGRPTAILLSHHQLAREFGRT